MMRAADGKATAIARVTSIGMVLLPCLLGGCIGAGQYRSARTLEAGEMDLGVNLAAAQVFRAGVKWDDGTPDGKERGASQQTVVSGMELHAHRGLHEGVEAGLRLVPGALGAEIDAKWRFYKTERLHVAAVAAVGRSWADEVAGWRALAQALVTWDLTETTPGEATWAVTGGLTAGRRGVAVPLLKENQDPTKHDDLRLTVGGDGGVLGAGLGIERRTDDWYLQPTIEVTRFGGDIGNVHYGITTVQLTVSGGWTFGKELAAFKKTQERLDRIAPSPR